MSSTPLTNARSPLPPPDHQSVTSFDGTSIHYDAYEPADASPTAVLVVPGFWRHRSYPSMVGLARFLADAGYRSAILDLRGHGQSGGTFGFNLHEHHDVAAVARDLMERRPAISSIILIGFSYGASIAVSTAARHELPLASLLLISPVADFDMITPRINPFTIHRHVAFSQALRRPRFAWTMRRSPKLRALDDVGNVHVPICLIHVKNDWLIDHRHSIALYEAANEPKELHLLDIEGNYHADRIFDVASDTIEPMVKGFLSKHAGRR